MVVVDLPMDLNAINAKNSMSEWLLHLLYNLNKLGDK